MKKKAGIFSFLELYSTYLPGPIYWKDRDSIYRGISQSALDTTNYTSFDAVIGKSDYDLWSECAKELIENDQYVMRTGKSLSKEEVLKLPDGRIKYYAAIKVPLRDDHGEIVGIIGNSVDITATKEMERLLHQSQIDQAQAAEQEKFRKLVGQMVHDIKSPLSSLRIIVQATTGIPENDRIALRNAAISISDITTRILNKYKNPDEQEEQKQLILVSAYILQVLSEKRLEYKNSSVNFDYSFVPKAYFTFIKIEPVNFKRMLSNLINNAVDALENRPDSKVILRLNIDSEYVIVAIEDNGKGMPEEIANKILNKERVSSGKPKGHGLGLGQVQDTLANNLGKMNIYSVEGLGTKISLYLPKMHAPNWLANKVVFDKGETVIILDDDNSIHAAWDAKLITLLKEYPEIKIKHFKQGTEVIEYIDKLSEMDKQKVYLLSDYELLNQDLNGLEVIERVKIAKSRSILVTSYYTDSKVRAKANDMGIRILPKDLVYAAKIKIGKEIPPRTKQVDMVWIDDDRSFVEHLIEQYYSNLVIDSYHDPIKFQDYIDDYALDTRFILDNHYYNEDSPYRVDGVMLAEILYEKGYTNLCLLSG